MDYVGEMLRRQRAALTALLLGGETAAEQPADTEPAAEPERAGERLAELPGEEAARSMRTAQTEQAPSGYQRAGLETGVGTPAQTRGGLLKQSSAGIWDMERNAGSSSSQAADVRAVSRAIQRDARRYDGGFFIY